MLRPHVVRVVEATDMFNDAAEEMANGSNKLVIAVMPNTTENELLFHLIRHHRGEFVRPDG